MMIQRQIHQIDVSTLRCFVLLLVMLQHSLAMANGPQTTPATQPVPPHGLTMHITPSRHLYEAGDRVDIVVRFENRSEKTYILHTIGGGPIERSYKAEVTRGPRTNVMPETRLATVMDWVKYATVLLPSGHVLEEHVCLSSLRDMSEGGRFKVLMRRMVMEQDAEVWNILQSNEIDVEMKWPLKRPVQPRPLDKVEETDKSPEG